MQFGRRTLVFLSILAVAILLAAAPGNVPPEMDAEEEAIRAVVQRYFDGIIEYDEDALRKAFHPKAQVIGTKDGELDWHAFQDWVLYTRGDAPDPTGRNNSILSIDVAGAAAVVKTELDWPNIHYIDYLSLLKIDGEWKIVNKIWHRERPSARDE